ncbi:STAS domain-containing protein [Nonomuraea sp. NPDC050691]|uniref:STAS domain-containing protein n=1 Tax=Nonomuraea sp. NPDC050691 TaxID=3155661 RepID=UPI0033EE5C2D
MTTHDDAPSGMPDFTPGQRAAAGVDAVLYLDRQLRVIYSPHPHTAVVRLIGELDAVNSPAVIDTLRRARREGEVLGIDVEQLQFVDVTGTRRLTGLCIDGHAHLINIPPRMRRLLDLPACPAPERGQRRPVVPWRGPCLTRSWSSSRPSRAGSGRPCRRGRGVPGGHPQLARGAPRLGEPAPPAGRTRP